MQTKFGACRYTHAPSLSKQIEEILSPWFISALSVSTYHLNKGYELPEKIDLIINLKKIV